MSSASEEPRHLFRNRTPGLRDIIPASPVSESIVLRIDRKNPPQKRVLSVSYYFFRRA
jgi:hypothetical protein